MTIEFITDALQVFTYIYIIFKTYSRPTMSKAQCDYLLLQEKVKNNG